MTNITDISEFRAFHLRRLMENPALFSPPTDPPATDSEIKCVEEAIQTILPMSYRDFLKEFGGGSFGYIDMYSVRKESRHYIIKRLQEYPKALLNRFLPISGDFTGGSYGYMIPIETEEIFYLDEIGIVSTTEFSNVFEFIARNSYSTS